MENIFCFDKIVTSFAITETEEITKNDLLRKIILLTFRM